MSSANSSPRCVLEIGPSRRLHLYSFSLVVAALLAPWLAAIPWWLALPASLFALLGVGPLRRWARGELRRIVWQAEGRWVLTDDNGKVHEPARLLPGVYVGANLLVLHWRCGCCRRKFRAALLADNCDGEDRRRLRVRLRLTPDAELFGNANRVS